MKIMAIDINSRNELRAWFNEHAEQETECWVVCRRGKMRPQDTLSYLDVVEEALCFGWIDSTYRSIGDGLRLQRLSKRKKGSVWSELNKARCKRLERLGLMTETGRRALENATEFYIDGEIQDAFRQNKTAQENFLRFPALYQRVRIDTIQRDKKKNRAVFEKRLAKLIENSQKNKMYGEWNDGGILE